MVIVGISKKLWSVGVVWGWIGEGKTLDPNNWICKPCPLSMKIWWGPSKGVSCWMFLASFLTWKKASELGNHDEYVVGKELATKELGVGGKLTTFLECTVSLIQTLEGKEPYP